ncbi:hypothetical protein [Kribbella kalugense]|uniref:Uncharacterized protein n=1 Tax=Kribbella kalugense TaxID=2512221 RepID=A0A4R7ZDC7_9ACTN|nr:hypothetical protein [Kribbella kalugense]TDW15577.1 hypothetical protein EV650_7064 [Kribbella kalugense]
MTAAAGLVLTGCGDESGTAGSPPPASPTPTAPTMPSVTQSTPVGVGLPLTVSRTGGFAGFDDQVLISADGVATVSSRGKETIRCKLDPSLLTTITSAAQQVDWASVVATKPTTKHPDDMILAVTANGKTARIEDPKLKPLAAPVSKLLTEAAIPPGKLCTKI